MLPWSSVGDSAVFSIAYCGLENSLGFLSDSFLFLPLEGSIFLQAAWFSLLVLLNGSFFFSS